MAPGLNGLLYDGRTPKGPLSKPDPAQGLPNGDTGPLYGIKQSTVRLDDEDLLRFAHWDYIPVST